MSKQTVPVKGKDLIIIASVIGMLGLVARIDQAYYVPPQDKVVNTTPQAITQEHTIASRGLVQRNKLTVTQAINKQLNGLLTNKGQVYVDAGKLEGVNPMLLAAISFHETRVQVNGKWVCISNVLREANNVAGINWNKQSIFEKYGRYNKYPSIDKSIFDMAEKLKYFYINEGKTDISSIGAKWAPMNDYQQGKLGMDNSIWAKEVTEIYTKILKEQEEK